MLEGTISPFKFFFFFNFNLHCGNILMNLMTAGDLMLSHWEILFDSEKTHHNGKCGMKEIARDCCNSDSLATS